MNVANVAYLYDLVLLGLFAFTAVRAWQSGFMAALVSLAGKVVGIVGAAWGSRQLAPLVYDKYLASALSTRAEAALAASGGDLAGALEQLSFLPATLRASLARTLTESTSALPQQLVDSLEPVLLPLLELVIAVVLCVAIVWGIRLFAGLLRHVNGVPLIGGVNRFFGLLLGLVTGAVNCWLLVVVLWFLMTITTGRVDVLAPGVLNKSIGYSFFSSFNPFLTHY